MLVSTFRELAPGQAKNRPNFSFAPSAHTFWLIFQPKSAKKPAFFKNINLDFFRLRRYHTRVEAPLFTVPPLDRNTAC
jgi:hypothetical protein